MGSEDLNRSRLRSVYQLNGLGNYRYRDGKPGCRLFIANENPPTAGDGLQLLKKIDLIKKA